MTYQFAAELAGRTIVITGGGRSIGREMVTAAVLYLASDQAPWMTGTEFVVDGGLLAGFAPMYPVVEGSD